MIRPFDSCQSSASKSSRTGILVDYSYRLESPVDGTITSFEAHHLKSIMDGTITLLEERRLTYSMTLAAWVKADCLYGIQNFMRANSGPKRSLFEDKGTILHQTLPLLSHSANPTTSPTAKLSTNMP